MEFLNSLNISKHKKNGLELGETVKTFGYDVVVPNFYQLVKYKPKITELQYSTHIIGKQGSGKSSLMQHMILQDIQLNDKAVLVLDPHGDMVEDILQRVGEKHKDRVTYFAPAYQQERPLGLNPFEWKHEIEISPKIEAMLSVFAHTWKINFQTSPRMQSTLTVFILLLLLSYKDHQTTLYHFHLLTREDEVGTKFRQIFLDNMIAKAERGELGNPALIYNLELWQGSLSKFKGDIESSGYKVGYLVMLKMLLPILSQPTSAECFNFNRLFDEKRVLLVNLRNIDAEALKLIGTIIQTQLMAAAKIRDVGKRSPCHIYADEFHKFSGDVFNEIIMQCRKFGLMVTLAHQNLAQAKENGGAYEAIKSCGNVICFDVIADDRNSMVREFQGLDEALFHELKPYHAICKIRHAESAATSSIIKAYMPTGQKDYKIAEEIKKRSLSYGRPLPELIEYTNFLASTPNRQIK